MHTNLPVVIEEQGEGKTTWLLSFGGSNPKREECIKLTKDQCFWLHEKIMNIFPSPLSQTMGIRKCSTL